MYEGYPETGIDLVPVMTKLFKFTLHFYCTKSRLLLMIKMLCET